MGRYNKNKTNTKDEALVGKFMKVDNMSMKSNESIFEPSKRKQIRKCENNQQTETTQLESNEDNNKETIEVKNMETRTDKLSHTHKTEQINRIKKYQNKLKI